MGLGLMLNGLVMLRAMFVGFGLYILFVNIVSEILETCLLFVGASDAKRSEAVLTDFVWRVR